MAGKRVKCPKCNEPLTIPAAKAPTPAARPGGGIADLLDEVGVRGARLGAGCPECGADVQPGAILCIHCGFNFATGRKMYTEADDSQYQDAHGESNVGKLLAKAERELDEAPISAEGEDFGDGPEAYLIAAIAGVAALVLAGIAVLTIILLDKLPQDVVALCSLLAAVVLANVGYWWITITAFMEKVGHGLGCFFCGFYAIYYAATRGLYLPLILWLGGSVFATIVQLFWPNPDDEFALQALQFFFS